MIQSLEQIRHLRKKYHLSQKDLAQRAGVSQSLIAKIESGSLDPTFTKAQHIFTALEKLQDTREVKAKQIMNTKVLIAGSHESLREIIKRMKNKGISQVPVMEKGKVVGMISENTILFKIAEHPTRINTLTAGEVMDNVPPIVGMETGLQTLLYLLQEFPVVLVAEKGETKGIISKTDVLGRIE
ncbi:TPA: CBS domain-containing protein [Candidatus Woesearchaeota archaeon]|nr:CBS domain-containing protein [Candidatus Woesearchaeota archaeon]